MNFSNDEIEDLFNNLHTLVNRAVSVGREIYRDKEGEEASFPDLEKAEMVNILIVPKKGNPCGIQLSMDDAGNFTMDLVPDSELSDSHLFFKRVPVNKGEDLEEDAYPDPEAMYAKYKELSEPVRKKAAYSFEEVAGMHVEFVLDPENHGPENKYEPYLLEGLRRELGELRKKNPDDAGWLLRKTVKAMMDKITKDGGADPDYVFGEEGREELFTYLQNLFYEVVSCMTGILDRADRIADSGMETRRTLLNAMVNRLATRYRKFADDTDTQDTLGTGFLDMQDSVDSPKIPICASARSLWDAAYRKALGRKKKTSQAVYDAAYKEWSSVMWGCYLLVTGETDTFRCGKEFRDFGSLLSGMAGVLGCSLRMDNKSGEGKK